MGATAASAEVQIEFLPPSDGRLDRSLAVALAAPRGAREAFTNGVIPTGPQCNSGIDEQ
jgi:hypothetical protein